MMERGRYNVGNSRMSKDCITYGASFQRNDPRSTVRENERERGGAKRERDRKREKAGESSTVPSLSFVKGNTIISSSLFAILKYVRRRSDCFYLLPGQGVEKEGGRRVRCQLRSLFVEYKTDRSSSIYCTYPSIDQSFSSISKCM